MKRKFEHLKEFNDFSKEIYGEKIDEKRLGKAVYKRTIDFLESDSKEAKEVNKLYDEYLKGKSTAEALRDPKLNQIVKRITRLGHKWAKDNNMAEPKDFNFSSVRTVKEGLYDRKFKGGPDVTVGESHGYTRDEMIEMLDKEEDCPYDMQELSEMDDEELEKMCSYNEGLRDIFRSKIGKVQKQFWEEHPEFKEKLKKAEKEFGKGEGKELVKLQGDLFEKLKKFRKEVISKELDDKSDINTAYMGLKDRIFKVNTTGAKYSF